MSEAAGETGRVVVTVLAVEPVVGAGRLVGLAVVELDIDGIVLELHGLRVVRRADGTAAAQPPAWRHPGTGTWQPAVVLPPEVERAVAGAVLEQGAGWGHPSTVEG